MIISIILKNLKMILRSPSTILLLILAPMILMFLIGLAYNSVNNLSKTQVGYFGTDSNYFSNLGVKFVNYNKNSVEESEIACKNDLKKGHLELCIFIQAQETQSGDLKSAQLVYIRDNTRSTIGNILISAIERELNKITDEISSTTISGILGEVDSTLEFMENTKELIEDIDMSIDKLNKDIQENDEDISSSIFMLKTTLPDILKTINSLRSSFQNLDSSNEESINNALVSLRDIKERLELLESTVEDLEEEIEDYVGFVPESVEEEIDEIYNQINRLKSLENSASNNVEDISSSLENIDSKQILLDLEKLEEFIEELIPTVNTLDTQYTNLKETLEDTQEEVKIIKEEVDTKYDYFSSLSSQDSDAIVKPISSEIKPLFSKFSRVHELAPTIIVTIMLFIGLLLSNVIVSMEMNSKAYFRNIISPIHQTSFIISLFFTSLIIILFQVFFFFVILQFVFNVPTFGIIDSTTLMFTKVLFFDTLVISLHILVVFILLGMLFSLLFSSMQISILVTTFVMLFFFLLSDIILPLELMPDFFHNILQYNPVVIGQSLFRELFFFSEVFELNFSKLMPFYMYTVILIILVTFAKNIKKKQLLN